MPSVPVSSEEPANSVLQSTFWDDIVSVAQRTGVLEKAANLQSNDILVQTVTNGDATHAPSSDAVFDFVADALSDFLATTVVDGDTTHAPTGNAVFDAIAALLTGAVANGDTSHAPSADAVFDFVEGKHLTATASLNFPNVVAFAKQDLTITVTGAAVGDSVALGAPAAINAGFLWCGWVSAADTVTVRVYNLTGVAINPPAQTWRATVFK